jgi:hypothetical protein
LPDRHRLYRRVRGDNVNDRKIAEDTRQLIQAIRLSGRTDLEAQVKKTEASLKAWERARKIKAGKSA